MFKKVISLVLSVVFSLQTCGFAQAGQINLAGYLGQGGFAPALDRFRPASLRYFSYEPDSDNFQILLDKADEKDLSDVQVKDKADELMRYFRIGLSLPNDKFWVNLRPDAPEQIIDPALERTDIGKIMLEADLQLKKDTSSLTSPQTKEGKVYWDKLYKKAGELFGTENITIPTITRPWIVPGEIIVRQSGNSAYIYKAALKVMLEEDYLKSPNSSDPNYQPLTSNYSFSDPRLKELNEYSTQLIRELIVPQLTKEVNRAKRYAGLRQAYYSLILARWFKVRYRSQRTENRGQSTESKENPYIKLIDSGNLANLASKEAWDKSAYFNQYKDSFNKGEYNLKEQAIGLYGQSVRSYVSGGISSLQPEKITDVFTTVGPAIVKPKNAVMLDLSRDSIQEVQTVASDSSSAIETPELNKYRKALLLTIRAYGDMYFYGFNDYDSSDVYKAEIDAVKKSKSWVSLLKTAHLFHKKIERAIEEDEVSKLQKEIYNSFLGTYRQISKKAINEQMAQSLRGLDLKLVEMVMERTLKLSEFGGYQEYNAYSKKKFDHKRPLGLKINYNNIGISNWMKPQEGWLHYREDNIQCVRIELKELLKLEYVGFFVILYSNGDVSFSIDQILVEDFVDEGEIPDSNIDWLTERIKSAITAAAGLTLSEGREIGKSGFSSVLTPKERATIELNKGIVLNEEKIKRQINASMRGNSIDKSNKKLKKSLGERIGEDVLANIEGKIGVVSKVFVSITDLRILGISSMKQDLELIAVPMEEVDSSVKYRIFLWDDSRGVILDFYIGEKISVSYASESFFEYYADDDWHDLGMRIKDVLGISGASSALTLETLSTVLKKSLKDYMLWSGGNGYQKNQASHILSKLENSTNLVWPNVKGRIPYHLSDLETLVQEYKKIADGSIYLSEVNKIEFFLELLKQIYALDKEDIKKGIKEAMALLAVSRAASKGWEKVFLPEEMRCGDYQEVQIKEDLNPVTNFSIGYTVRVVRYYSAGPTMGGNIGGSATVAEVQFRDDGLLAFWLNPDLEESLMMNKQNSEEFISAIKYALDRIGKRGASSAITERKLTKEQIDLLETLLPANKKISQDAIDIINRFLSCPVLYPVYFNELQHAIIDSVLSLFSQEKKDEKAMISRALLISAFLLNAYPAQIWDKEKLRDVKDMLSTLYYVSSYPWFQSAARKGNITLLNKIVGLEGSKIWNWTAKNKPTEDIIEKYRILKRIDYFVSGKVWNILEKHAKEPGSIASVESAVKQLKLIGIEKYEDEDEKRIVAALVAFRSAYEEVEGVKIGVHEKVDILEATMDFAPHIAGYLLGIDNKIDAVGKIIRTSIDIQHDETEGEYHQIIDDDDKDRISYHFKEYEAEYLLSVAKSQYSAEIHYRHKSSSALTTVETVIPGQEGAQVGGIDFRQMDILIQPQGSFRGLDFSPVVLSGSALEAMDLERDLEGINQMTLGRRRPHPQRLKEYVSACIFKGKIDEKADDFILSMLEVFQLQAEEGIESASQDREAVVLADTRGYVLPEKRLAASNSYGLN